MEHANPQDEMSYVTAEQETFVNKITELQQTDMVALQAVYVVPNTLQTLIAKETEAKLSVPEQAKIASDIFKVQENKEQETASTSFTSNLEELIENSACIPEVNQFSSENLQYVSENKSSIDNPEYAISPDWSSSAPTLFSKVEKEFQRFSTSVPSENNYLRGCQWSPDGTCLLTNSCDNVFRIFEFPPALTETPEDLNFIKNAKPEKELSAVLWMREHELVYDYCWYPLMQSSDPASCVFASTSRRTPVHLWDAFDGSLRATYRPFNHMGELVAAQSVAFSADGQLLYCGFNRYIQVFRVDRPGSQSERRPRIGKKPDQGGIISALGVLQGDDSRNLYAAGSFSGSVGVYTEPGKRVAIAQGPRLGVSQVTFSKPPHNSGAPWYLVAGGRADSQIHIWDGRWMRDPFTVLYRRVENYQRFQFGLDPTGRYLFTGNQTGAVSTFDLTSPTVATGVGSHDPPTMLPVSVWRGSEDSCHGLSVHPTLPCLATASGQKRFRSIKRSAAKRPLSTSKRVICEKCKEREILTTDKSAPKSTSSSVCSSDSELDIFETGLSDEDSALGALSGGLLSDNILENLPLRGSLTRLPIRNQVTVWAFPKHDGTNL